MVFFRAKSLLSILFAITLGASFAFSQATTATPAAAKPAATPNAKNPAAPASPEQIVESSIIIYAFPGGRETLNQIRKTTFERGRITVTDAQGKSESASYRRWVLRAATLNKEKIRIDQDYPSSRYSLVLADEQVYGIVNTTVFAPREDVKNSFLNGIFHGIEALFRYKENESKIEFAGREKLMGVEYFMIDITDKQDRKTRFYVSVKSFRVMMLDYQDGGVKYRRKFYNHNYAQGTLFPFRTILTANGKTVEETDVSTITFGQKVDEALFREIKP